MKTILVTGANGHIGASCVRDLLANGYRVVGMVREGADLRGLAGLELELRTGDVLDAASVREAVRGVDGVFHLAQPYVLDEDDPEAVIRPGVVGTEHVFGAMKEEGIERVVYTSSCAAVGLSEDANAPLDETTFREDGAIPYIEAKIQGERRALALGRELGLEVVVTLPVGVLGPWDFKPTPTMLNAYDTANGKGPLPMAVNFTDVRDVAAAHRLAFERGRAGERYLVGGELMQPAEAVEVIGELTGKTPAATWPPRWILSTLITITGWFGAAPMSKTALDDVYGKHFAYDCQKARDELGFAPRPPADAIREALRWGAFVGALKPAVAAKVRAKLPPDPEWVEARAA